MEPAQINQAMEQYERELGEEYTPLENSELLDRVTWEQWWRDIGDWLMPDTPGQALALKAVITAALKSKERRDREMFDMHCAEVGRLVCRCVETTLEEYDGRGLL